MNSELKKLIKDKNIAASSNKWKEAADHCNYIGSELSRLGQHEEALDYHLEELNFNDIINNRLGSAVANRKIGECYSQLNKFNKALSYIEVFKKIATEIGNALETQRAWATLGRTFYLKFLFEQESVDLDKAEASYKQALELANQLKCELSEKEFAEMKARCLLNLGLVYELRSDIQQCSKCIQTAIYLASKYDLHEDLNRCQSSLASVFMKHEQFNLALQLLDGAITTAEKLKDKTLLCDELSTKASIMLSLKDFDGAKHCLKRAYKLRCPVKEDHEKVTRSLKICIGLCVSQNKLQETDISDCYQRKCLLEKIADGLSSLDCYKLAIEYYFSTLQCMEESNFTMPQKAPIYFSIAMTYRDMGDNEKALKYLNEELICNETEPSEQIKTLWKVSEILEELENVSEAEKIHLQAVSLSQKTGSKKLLFKALTKLSSFYEQNGMHEKLEEINSKLEKKSFQDMSSDESASEEESQDPFKDIHLSDLSDSEDKVASTSTIRPKRQPKKPSLKRNAKGETPLHKACIEGKFNEVKKLVECGHSVNVADFGGWMPLHEASNHGHFDIVQYLLDKGASINARGNGGITALHDAASNGYLDVMQLLISSGASVTVLDDEKNTPLQTLLGWKRRADLDSDTLRLCGKIEEELKAKMLQAGQPVAAMEEESVPANFYDDFDDDKESLLRTSPVRATEKRSRPASFSSEEEYSNGLDELESFTPQLDTEREWESPAGAHEYKSVMSNLRRSGQQNILSQPKIVQKKVEKKSGLVDEDEVAGGWLILDTKQDIKKTQRKRRKAPRLNVRTSKSLYNYLEPKNTSSDGDISPSDYNEVCIDDSSNESLQISNPSQRSHNNKPADSVQNNGLHSIPCPIPSKLPFWLKVYIGDKCIHVPVPEDSLSIEWLAEEAASRYQSEHLSRPHLTSLTKIDGATLLNTDIIKNSLAHNEELKSSILKWDEPSIETRYTHLCRRQKVEPLTVVLDELVKFNTTCEINFSNFALEADHINIIFEVLPHFRSILHLYFNGTMLSSSNILPVINCFPYFISLVTLDLSCCALFTDTLQQFAEYLEKQSFRDNRLPRLKTLRLDYNLFCSPCSSHLTAIIKLTSLAILGLSHCDLDATTFEDPRLCQTLECCTNLQEFNISGNVLTEKSMTNLLYYIPKLNIVKLDFTNTAEQCTNFLNDLKHNLNFPELRELSLVSCGLKDEDIFSLTPINFQNLPKLKSVNISGNSKLSASAIIHFIKVASSKERALDFRIDGTCEWDVKAVFEFIDQLDFECLNSVMLNNISVTGKEELFDWWKRSWTLKASCIDSIFCKISLN